MSSITLSKQRRYDRQLRLWGDRGQEKLGRTNVCILGANAVGSELLKNLVLPGIGEFTIVDDALVTKKDMGSNFFITSSSIGKPRAQVVTECLSEINTEVRGKFIVESLDTLIDNDPNFFLDFDVIVYTDINESQLIRINRIASQAHIPIVVCVSVGFIGFLRVSVQEHAVIESHPNSIKPDFRLDNPPDAFVRLVNDPDNDLDSLPAGQLSQVPWLIVLYKFLLQFQQLNGRFPESYSDKQQIRKLIDSAANSFPERCRSRGETVEANFELTNFREASKAVNMALAKTEIPSDVLQIFEDCPCQWLCSANDRLNPNQASKSTGLISNLSMSSFWKLVGALKEYTMNEGGGKLPIRGDLPDMTSSSSRYLKLLAIYREAYETAVEQVASRLSHLDELRLDDVRLLVRNAAYIRVIRCRSLEEELKLSPARSDDLHLIPAHEENDAMLWYLVLRGAASFRAEHGRWPGSPCGASTPVTAAAVGGDHQFSPHIVELDMPCLRGHVNRVLTSSGVGVNRVSDDFVHEMCHFGGGEVHSIAAFMGGIGAQEVIKLATHQFLPICQPAIYNAITQRVTLLEF